MEWVFFLHLEEIILTNSQIGGPRAWTIWFLAALTFGFAFFWRVSPGVMVTELMTEFQVGAAVLGNLSALYFYPYVLLQIPLGALLDRFGARMLLTIALGIAAIGAVLFGSATSLGAAYAGRALIGAGSAVGFIGSLALAAKWFPTHRFALLAGLAMFLAMLCGIAGQAPLAIAIANFGWRSAMIASGCAAAILAIVVLLVVRNGPLDNAATQKPVSNWGEIGRGLWQAAASGHVWLIAIVAAAMSGPMLAFGGLWGTPFLMTTYGMSRPQAAFYVSLLLFGWALGAPTCGWLSDRLRTRKKLLLGPSLIATLCLAAIVLVPAIPLALLAGLIFVLGFVGAGMTVGYALARELTPGAIHGSVTGIVNAMTVASGAVLQPLIGLALDRFWDGTMANGMRLYDAVDYRNALTMLVAWAAAGFLAALFLHETGAKQQHVPAP